MRARETKPIWTTSTFLVYTGGLTVLGAAIGALAYLSTQYPGDGAGTAWSLLIFVILLAIANGLLLRDRTIAAGIFAFSSVIAFAILVAVFFQWIGWHINLRSLDEWCWSRLVWLILVLGAASAARFQFRFPFIRLISAVLFWMLVVTVLPSGHQLNYVWSLLVGLLYLGIGSVVEKPSAFWLHFIGGLLIGIPILHWFDKTTFDFAVIAFMSLVFVALAYRTRRSIWAVYGTIGFFVVTNHFLGTSGSTLVRGILPGQVCTSSAGPATCQSLGPHIDAWSIPLAFGLLGFWLVLLGMATRRGRHHHHAAPVVVMPPAPPAASEPLAE